MPRKDTDQCDYDTKKATHRSDDGQFGRRYPDQVCDQHADEYRKAGRHVEGRARGHAQGGR